MKDFNPKTDNIFFNHPKLGSGKIIGIEVSFQDRLELNAEISFFLL